jgi:hypothetical protein
MILHICNDDEYCYYVLNCIISMFELHLLIKLHEIVVVITSVLKYLHYTHYKC